MHHSKIGRPMSALGQKRTLRGVRPMSALPPKADIGTHSRDVCFVPEADERQCSKNAENITPLMQVNVGAHRQLQDVLETNYSGSQCSALEA